MSYFILTLVVATGIFIFYFAVSLWAHENLFNAGMEEEEKSRKLICHFVYVISQLIFRNFFKYNIF